MATLSSEVRERYWSQGWVVVEGVFPQDEINAVRELAMSVSHAELDPQSSNTDRGEPGSIAPRKISEPFLKHEAFRRLALDARLTDRIEALIGVPPLLCTDQIFMKPPQFGSAKPYHQDNAYFKIEPADHVITAWIAMDDVDEDNGCLRYIDGSHRGPILPHLPIEGESHNLAPAPELIDLSRESLARVRTGGVVFHHAATLHTSHRNVSDRWRRAYATHWVSAQCASTTAVLDRPHFRDQTYAPTLEALRA